MSQGRAPQFHHDAPDTPRSSSLLVGCSATPPIFLEQGATNLPPRETAEISREFCIGGGRGLIHFTALDGQRIGGAIGATAKLVVTPGRHTVEVLYLAPDSTIFARWEGAMRLTHDFEANSSYVLRYERTDIDRYRAWIEKWAGTYPSDGAPPTSASRRCLAMSGISSESGPAWS